ncbi:transcription repressor OFP14 [Thalictrum thalictroides]|uniref:Transcription repressor n=1 Tax=Thalictrum thalictroides TaxID=46969 RepID=A0A7J6XBR3_THATH|nr:transcription repressor OFP14 [Thalictrum thalictroides]
MSKRIQKSVHGYFSKLKQHAPHVHLPSKSITSSTNWILSGCKYPKTPSFAIDKKANEVPCPREGHAATLSDVDRFLLENFSSLFCDEKKMNNNNDDDDDDDNKKKIDGRHYDDESTNGFLFESPRLIGPMPEIRTSQRFFVSHSTSSSLVEEAQSIASTFEEVRSTTTTTTSTSTTATNFKESIRTSTEIKGVPLPDESIAVLTYSPDPYNDFRQSMEEMVEARLNQNQSIDWDFMEELLFCYLKLNEKKSYRYILSAFVDLTASLKRNSDKTPARERHIPAKSVRRKKKNGLV